MYILLKLTYMLYVKYSSIRLEKEEKLQLVKFQCSINEYSKLYEKIIRILFLLLFCYQAKKTLKISCTDWESSELLVCIQKSISSYCYDIVMQRLEQVLLKTLFLCLRFCIFLFCILFCT